MFVGRVPDYFLGRPTVKGAEEYDALSAITLGRPPPGSARPLRGARVRPRSGRLRRPPPARMDRRGVERRARHPRPLAVAARRAPTHPRPGRSRDRPWRSWRCSWLIGAGWASWTFGDRWSRPRAAAPAFGVATLTIVGTRVGADRVSRSPARGARRSPQRWPASAGMGSDSSRGRRAWIRRRRSMSDHIDHHEHHRRHDPVPEPQVHAERVGVAQRLGGPLREREGGAGRDHRGARRTREQPHDRQRPHDVPRQQHRTQQHQEHERPPDRGAELLDRIAGGRSLPPPSWPAR